MTKNYNFFSKSNCGNTISLYYETKKKPSLLNKKKKGIKIRKGTIPINMYSMESPVVALCPTMAIMPLSAIHIIKLKT